MKCHPYILDCLQTAFEPVPSVCCCSRIPVGSFTNIESRESPLCSIADENETSKLTYKKSVFKKKSTSSTATVSPCTRVLPLSIAP